MAEAAHITKNHDDGCTHTVGFGDLRVMVLEEDGIWYAQGMEVDYIAQGVTKEDAMRAFEDGLAKTIRANLEHVGHIRGLLQTADSETWGEFYSQSEDGQYFYSCVSKHALKERSDEPSMVAFSKLPFEQIAYMCPQAA